MHPPGGGGGVGHAVRQRLGEDEPLGLEPQGTGLEAARRRDRDAWALGCSCTSRAVFQPNPLPVGGLARVEILLDLAEQFIDVGIAGLFKAGRFQPGGQGIGRFEAGLQCIHRDRGVGHQHRPDNHGLAEDDRDRTGECARGRCIPEARLG